MFESRKNLTAQEIGYNLLREGNRVEFDHVIAEVSRAKNWDAAASAARKILRAQTINNEIDANQAIIGKIMDILRNDSEVPVGSTFRLREMAKYLRTEHNIRSKTYRYYSEALAMTHLKEALDNLETSGEIEKIHGFDATYRRVPCVFYKKIK